MPPAGMPPAGGPGFQGEPPLRVCLLHEIESRGVAPAVSFPVFHVPVIVHVHGILLFVHVSSIVLKAVMSGLV